MGSVYTDLWICQNSVDICLICVLHNTFHQKKTKILILLNNVHAAVCMVGSGLFTICFEMHKKLRGIGR